MNTTKPDIKIFFIEKLIVNFAIPSDFIYHYFKSAFTNDEYSSQTPGEKISGIYNGKIEKYHKLLVIKRRHNGKIPEGIKTVCKETLCGRVRLGLTYLRK